MFRDAVKERVRAAWPLERAPRLRKLVWRAGKRLRSAPSPAVAKPSVPTGNATPTRPAVQTPARPHDRFVGVEEPNDLRGGWIPSDPHVPFPEPSMKRHDLLQGLHREVRPRTYLEIGVSTGQSLALSRARSIGIDPEFRVTHPIHCDVSLEREKSDEFFERDDPLAHFGGTPLDLAFIDGMHLAEYALRDFMNLEKHLDPAGVVVFDDVLPRNGLEAARNRLTSAWAGDVYKVLEVLESRRPDLVVLRVNTLPTGTAVVIGADPGSVVLEQSYADDLVGLRSPDPQAPSMAVMSRSSSVDAETLMASPGWELLRRARETGDHSLVVAAKEAFAAVPRLGARDVAPVAPAVSPG